MGWTLSPGHRSRKRARNRRIPAGFQRSVMIERAYLAALSAIVEFLVRIALDP